MGTTTGGAKKQWGAVVGQGGLSRQKELRVQTRGYTRPPG